MGSSNECRVRCLEGPASYAGVSGRRVKPRAEMLAPRAFGFPGELSSLKLARKILLLCELIVATCARCREVVGQFSLNRTRHSLRSLGGGGIIGGGSVRRP